jgi:aminoglycoside N3'-acetyltransferase
VREVTQDLVVTCLKSLGIGEGDGLLVHSAVQFLGRPIPDIGLYLAAVQEVIGPRGTLVVPTFNFAFTRGEPFDPLLTPSEGMGAFSEYVRQHPQARRTCHPMQSVAAIGFDADDLAERDTPSAFDPGSAFERMLDLEFKLLLLGANSRAIAMFHYCEQRANVPYRYWKEFTGQVNTAQGWQMRAYRLFVRYLDPQPHLTLDPLVAYMQARGEWLSLPLNYGKVTTCTLKDFVTAADHFLSEDPWSMVTNRSECVKNL